MTSIRVGPRTAQLSAAVAMATALGIGSAGPLNASASQPSADPSQVLSPGSGVSPNQRAINTQIQTGRTRFAVTSRQRHPGTPEAITHPQLDHAGSGLSALPHAGVAAPNVTTPTSSSLPGLDVSSYQGNVNWAQVAANGAQFAYVKATEGTYYTNPYFGGQYGGAYNTGLVRGAYHFANPSNSSGAAQADFFVANGGAWSADNQTLPGALDIEYDPYGSECYGLTQPQMVSWISDFVNEYHAITSRWAAIYSTTDWWSRCTGNTAIFATRDPLWIANYNGTPQPLPAGWSSYAIWQYADHGTFPGDQDSFNGTHDQLVALANNGPPTNTPPAVTGVEGSDAALWVRHSADSAFTGLGGVLSGAPAIAAVSQASGPPVPLYIVTGSDHRLWVRSDTQGFQLLSNDPNTYCIDNPAAVVTGTTLTVACQGGDHALYMVQGPVSAGSLPSLSGFTNLGGVLVAGPAAAPVGGSLTFLVNGTDGHVWSRTSSSAWTSMAPWGCLGHPALATAADNISTFACDGTDHALWYATNNNGAGWSFTQSLGGVLVDGPGLAATSAGTVFFVEGSDSALWHNFIPDGGNPTGWVSDGGVLRQGAGAVGLG